VLSRRTAYFAIAPLVCLLLFYRVLRVWFLTDDFAWLGLPLSVHNTHQLLNTLFRPQAQGTIRVLSERLYFLVFSSLFGLNAVFYRLWALATWFADLALAAAIGSRLTRSRAAGVLAAVLWTSSVAVTRALAWAAAYDQLLCAFCLLAAFYARLRWLESNERKWLIAEWAAYLAGFGALETIVMYPLLAALHGWCAGRKKLVSIAALCVPAAALTAFHLFVIPPDPNYPIIVDRRMPIDFLRYLGWTIGPRLLGNFPGHFHGRGVLVVAAIGGALALFLLRGILRRELMPVFFCGWFVLMLAPVLPLPNNVQDYYLTLPVLGIAWLAGWAIAAAWESGWVPRVIALALLALYLPGSILQIDDGLHWFLDHTQRMRTVVVGLRDAARAHRDTAFLLVGVDRDLYDAGFEDDPFRLIGLSRVFVAANFPVAPRFAAPAETVLGWMDLGQVRVLEVNPKNLRDITADYESRLRAKGAGARHAFVDVGDPAYASLLGPEWYQPEQHFRWMSKRATVKLSGPTSPSEKLYITGYVPAMLLQAGPVELHVRADGREIGSATLQQPDQMFSLEFALPAELVGQASIEIAVEVNRTIHAPGDPRELGVIVQSFEIR
jgi:hypothetical protein